MSFARRGRRLSTAVLLALAGLTVGLPTTPPPTAAARAFQLDLHRPGDFVAQTNLVQCVGASMQMMINIVSDRDDRSATTQRRLWQLARTHSPPRRSVSRKRQGASVYGWSAGLNELGFGPYQVAGFKTIDEAMRAAAHAMRLTRRPVGLLVWAGRHAWVMNGFTATADPLDGGAFRVTHAYVLDPLYPRTSPTWGPSPRPGSRLSLKTLGQDFVPRRRNWSGPLSGKYVLVLPVSSVSEPVQLGSRSLH